MACPKPIRPDAAPTLSKIAKLEFFTICFRDSHNPYEEKPSTGDHLNGAHVFQDIILQKVHLDSTRASSCLHPLDRGAVPDASIRPYGPLDKFTQFFSGQRFHGNVRREVWRACPTEAAQPLEPVVAFGDCMTHGLTCLFHNMCISIVW